MMTIQELKDAVASAQKEHDTALAALRTLPTLNKAPGRPFDDPATRRIKSQYHLTTVRLKQAEDALAEALRQSPYGR
jgi:hypothetical protein